MERWTAALRNGASLALRAISSSLSTTAESLAAWM
jgi:hypothetical protein